MTWLEDLWWRDGAAPGRPLLAILALAEVGFRAGVAVRSALHESGLARPAVAPVPVISIGNLTVGGAGKTPVTLAVAERLRARGRNVAILSRGYGARRGGARVVGDGRRVLLTEEEAGDEPLLLARRLSGAAVLCGPRRADLAARAVGELGADVLVLDDGFQHRALARDLDVVVLDAASPTGNGRLLPRGPNREPWDALGRAHLAWISRADQAGAPEVEALRTRLLRATGRPPVESRHAVRDVLDGVLTRAFGAGALDGRRVLLLCALARPDGFRRTLSAMGAQVVAERVFRDHHRFTPDELEEALRAAGEARCDAVATTEKDAVRLPARIATDPRWRVVRIDVELLAGADELDRLLGSALQRGDARRKGMAGRAAGEAGRR